MRNLILYLLRYGSFVLFLFLEGICIFMLVNYNESQKEIFLNSSGNLNGRVNSFTHRVGEIYGAHRELDSLAEVVRDLRTQNLYLISLLEENELDTMTLDTGFTYHAARVIQNSINKSNNFITINRGSNQGIEPRMGVVSDNGIVGVVRDVSSNFSTIMSILHRQSQVSCKLKNVAFFGNLKWQGLNPDVVFLEDVPKHASVSVGDTVQTSGYSRHFPAGLDVGKVKDITLSQGSNSYTIEVDLFNDMSNLEVVYILKDEQVVELDSLITMIKDE